MGQKSEQEYFLWASIIGLAPSWYNFLTLSRLPILSFLGSRHLLGNHWLTLSGEFQHGFMHAIRLYKHLRGIWETE